MNKIPGTPAGPIPPGGVVLSGIHELQQPRRTDRLTEFHGCRVGFYALLDDNNICKGYRIQIQDPMDNHTYNLDFEQEILNEFRNNLTQFPNVGEKPDAV